MNHTSPCTSHGPDTERGHTAAGGGAVCGFRAIDVYTACQPVYEQSAGVCGGGLSVRAGGLCVCVRRDKQGLGGVVVEGVL